MGRPRLKYFLTCSHPTTFFFRIWEDVTKQQKTMPSWPKSGHPAACLLLQCTAGKHTKHAGHIEIAFSGRGCFEIPECQYSNTFQRGGKLHNLKPAQSKQMNYNVHLLYHPRGEKLMLFWGFLIARAHKDLPWLYGWTPSRGTLKEQFTRRCDVSISYPKSLGGKQHPPFFIISQFFCRYLAKFTTLLYPFSALGGNKVAHVKP